jgi:hypothetical protein
VVGVLRIIYLPFIVMKLLGFNFLRLIARAFIYSLYAFLISLGFYEYAFEVKTWTDLLGLSMIIFVLIIGGSIFIFSANERTEVLNWLRAKIKK